MKPHSPDPVSLIGGLTFLLVAIGFGLSNTSDVHLRWLFVVPTASIVVGGAILATVARRMTHPVDDDATVDDLVTD